MTAQAILDRLRSLGASVSLVGDKLRVEAPAGVLTPDLRQELIEHKAELLELLRPFAPPVILGPHGEDPLDFRRNPLTRDWWCGPAQAPEIYEARAPCPRCGGRRFWVSVVGSRICATCYPPRPGDRVLGWIAPEEVH